MPILSAITPTQKKAVYCRYRFNDQNNYTGSSCEFVAIEGKQVVYYDISDMERNNLEWWQANSHFEPYQVASYVAKWQDKPTTYFGFQLLTNVNYNNFGIGYNY